MSDKVSHTNKQVSNSIEDLLSHQILRHSRLSFRMLSIALRPGEIPSVPDRHSCATHRKPTAFFSLLKRPEGWACLLPLIVAEVKNGWSCTSIPQPIFLHGARLNQAHGHFTFMCTITSEDKARSTDRKKMNSNEMKEESCSNVAFEKRV